MTSTITKTGSSQRERSRLILSFSTIGLIRSRAEVRDRARGFIEETDPRRARRRPWPDRATCAAGKGADADRGAAGVTGAIATGAETFADRHLRDRSRWRCRAPG